jgi:ArsR family transcriptional regulator, nickel/cobalt-responsive transcriptional repressor
MGHGIEGHAKPAVVDSQTARQVAETMHALATPSRVRILARLREGACNVNELAENVNELAEAVEMEGSAVSHQLRVLRHLGLVVGERSGRSVFYALHDSHVADLLDQAVFHVEHLRLGLVERQERSA